MVRSRFVARAKKVKAVGASPKTAELGEVYFRQHPDRRYSACQVTWTDEKKVEILALDWLGKKPPTAAAIAKSKPLVLDHHSHRGREYRIFVEPVPHWSLTLLGKLPPVKQYRERTLSYSAWTSAGSQRILQSRWDARPKRERAAFDAAVDDSGALTVPLGGTKHEIPLGTSTLVFTQKPASGSGMIGVGADEKIPWKELEKLGRLTEVRYSGSDSGFADFLRRHRMVSNVTWTDHGLRKIDLGETGVSKLSVEATGKPFELVLGDVVDWLGIRKIGKSNVRVFSPLSGAGTLLWLTEPELPSGIVGLERLSRIGAIQLRSASLDRLERYEDLAELALTGAPGELVRTDSLSKLAGLREIELRDFYEMDVERFPDRTALEQLASFEMWGLKKAHADVLKERLTGLRQLKLGGARTDEWIAVNANNPFRQWGEFDPKLEKPACKAFKAAMAAAQSKKKPTKKAAEKILHTFIDAFTKLDAKHGLDTTHREDVYEAMHTIGSELPNVSKSDVDDFFGAWVDF